MKHSLQLKIGQHLTLTPQLQQSIRLLQLSTLELNQELEQMLQDNPMLELENETPEFIPAETALNGSSEAAPAEAPAPEPGPAESQQATEHDEASSALDDADWTDYSGSTADDEDGDFHQAPGAHSTLREHLLNQLLLTPLPPRIKLLTGALIEDVNEDGFLTQNLDEIAQGLGDELNAIRLDEMQLALAHLQDMDPVGVGARDLGECLSLQLRALPRDTPGREHALTIVQTHLGLLAARDLGKIKKAMVIDETELRTARSLILGLNPRPGSAYGRDDTHYVVPDVFIRKVKGMWLATLNSDAMPKLRINRVYADILSRHREQGGNQLSSQLQEARWLIKNVQQRFDTILRVSQAIVDRQKQFFEHGEVAMRPLVLREIAEAVELHESTISRVTTQKFIMTPRGLYELKYFFGSHVATETGGACSSTAIRALIKQLIATENTKKPLSDGDLAAVLGQQGIVVARRTIAKYRESMQIPTANLRRAL
jgi:RNA polymerase sigma-54 factor